MSFDTQSQEIPRKFEDYSYFDEIQLESFGLVQIVNLNLEPDKMKIIKRVKYQTELDKKIVDDEITLLKRVGSKYTLRFIESFQHGFELFIVMELCENGNLRNLIEEMKSWSIKDKKIGVTFIGLNPQNILMDKAGNAKIGIFNLSKKFDNIQKDLKSWAQAYQPPEVHAQKKPSVKSDIWILGVLILEMLLKGSHPFEGRTIDDTVSNIKAGDILRFPNYIEGEFKEMLISMINSDPTKRPSVEQLLDSELMQILAHIDSSNELREKQAEEKAHETEIIVQLLEEKVRVAEEKTWASDEKIIIVEEKAKVAEQRANKAELLVRQGIKIQESANQKLKALQLLNTLCQKIAQQLIVSIKKDDLQIAKQLLEEDKIRFNTERELNYN
ncbi:MAG: putative AGC family protein kinase, partial [Streblomastix strix]